MRLFPWRALEHAPARNRARFGNCSATLVVMRERRGTWLGEIAWHLPIELMGGASGDGTAALFR